MRGSCGGRERWDIRVVLGVGECTGCGLSGQRADLVEVEPVQMGGCATPTHQEYSYGQYSPGESVTMKHWGKAQGIPY
jgi:hypothetical protein